MAQINHPPRCRYAPSPSGPLHLGNLRTALLAWLHCRLQGGTFVLRIDDLDTSRVKPGSEASIIDDLYWLGLDWDEGPDVGGDFGPYRQSERLDIYQSALNCLRDDGALFPCHCSRAVLAAISAPHGESSVYPGTCRLETDWNMRNGRDPSWRWHMPNRRLCFDDGVLGAQSFDLAQDIGDVVLRRADGFMAYHLATAVDESSMAIDQVVRGADLLPTTPVQLALIEALGGRFPAYWHVPLLLDAAGKRMAKRADSVGLAFYKAQGFWPEDVVAVLLAPLGLLPKDEAYSLKACLASLTLQALTAAL